MVIPLQMDTAIEPMLPILVYLLVPTKITFIKVFNFGIDRNQKTDTKLTRKRN